MNDAELHELRREKWRANGKAIRTLEEARTFIESVGFCLMYPMRPPLMVPTFVSAFKGFEQHLPTQQHAFRDSHAQEATELMVRLLRERDAYEANLFGENNTFLIAASVFPYLYALVGERNPKLAPKAGPRAEYSDLACDTFAAIQRGGPISKQKLLDTLGGGVSGPALDKSLTELGAKLRITRVDYRPIEGASWDVLYRWAPDAVREGVELSVGEALSALVSKYLDCVIAADQTELESFFGHFVARSRVKDSVNALLGAREFEFVRIGNRSLVRITPVKAPVVPRASHENSRTRFREFSAAREKSRKPFPVSPPIHSAKTPGLAVGADTKTAQGKEGPRPSHSSPIRDTKKKPFVKTERMDSAKSFTAPRPSYGKGRAGSSGSTAMRNDKRKPLGSRSRTSGPAPGPALPGEAYVKADGRPRVSAGGTEDKRKPFIQSRRPASAKASGGSRESYGKDGGRARQSFAGKNNKRRPFNSPGKERSPSK